MRRRTRRTASAAMDPHGVARREGQWFAVPRIFIPTQAELRASESWGAASRDGLVPGTR